MPREESERVVCRRATRDDVPRIVALLADDMLGREREPPADQPGDHYYQAFEAIDSDWHHELIVAECGGRVVKRRPEALQFYQRLGFTHEGLKLRLSTAPQETNE